ncbi:protein kinase [Streptomyces sodiiphilus]|uniref:Protein kinase n=1 Tax=Streptomyces sodiiphilus TaxID=226217 RepID=A0ABN2PGV2_9ACTN
MDKYAGRLLADRYRLPRPPSDEFELAESPAFDTASGQEVLVRQVPLPEVVDAEVLDEYGRPGPPRGRARDDRATRTPQDPVVRRAVEAAAAAARLPDHARLDQVFDVFVQGDGLWIVSELVSARPLAALLAEQRMNPYRAAEVAADILAALRVVHAHGWTHRNLTARTVLVCDDGRAVLTGLAAGAAEEVLCGYDPLPGGGSDGPSVAPAVEVSRETPPGPQTGSAERPAGLPAPGGPVPPALRGAPPAERPELPDAPPAVPGGLPPGYVVRQGHSPAAHAGPPGGAAGGAADLVARMREQGGLPARQEQPADASGGFPASWDFESGQEGGGHAVGPAAPLRDDRPSPAAVERAARSGAIAAYRAGARAGADAANGVAGERPPGHPTASRAPAQAARPPPPRPGQQPGGPARQASPAPGGAAAPGSGPTALPGPGRTSHPVPWERAPAAPGGGPERRDGQPGAGQPRTDGERWGEVPPPESRYRGPDSALAAERARQARITTVGAVTERWAPEQAGPVYEHWRLAPPVGPAADLWALGALLFRAVQGHPPYPEESAAELTQAVCAEQPAFAEECGALRPVVESLLRQDPTERPSPEELRGWLRSIIRSAPEPNVGRRTVTAPPALEAGRPSDPRRLPVVRRRGEMVGPRRRRPQGGDPHRLGKVLLGLVMAGMAGAVAYALLFMERDEPADGGGEAGRGAPAEPELPGAPDAGETGGQDGEVDDGEGGNTGRAPHTAAPDPPPEGYELHEDASGFWLAVPEGWQRQGPEGDGPVRFTGGSLELLVVPGRDSAAEFGDDPMKYQLTSLPELQGYRDAARSTSSSLRRIDVGPTSMAEGLFAWQADGDRLARNRAMLMGGSYHVVMVRGPESAREELDEIFEVSAESYRFTG